MRSAAASGTSSVSSTGYRDGLGHRSLEFDRTTGDILERLVLRPELWAFEPPIRDALMTVSGLEDERFARLRDVQRDEEGRLTVASEYVAGRRLSEALDLASELGIVGGLDAALGLLLEIVPALARLHEAGRIHGVLGPGYVTVTSDLQLVLLDSLFAQALEHLHFSPERLWSELRVARAADEPSFDIAGDLSQAAMLALSVMVGRPLRSDEFPWGLGTLRQEVLDVASIRGSNAFARALETFLDRILPMEGRRSYRSADEAAIDLRKLVRREMGIEACRSALVDFFQQIDNADAEHGDRERDGAGNREAERQAAERVEAERLAQEQAQAERHVRETADVEERTRQRAEAERLAREQADADERERQRVEAERVAQEKAQTERVAREKADAEERERKRIEAERVAREKAEADERERKRIEAERLAREKAEAERVAREKAEAAERERKRAEAERVAREKAEAEERERKRLEAERIAKEKAEAERVAREKAEAEERERKRLEAERIAKEKAEAERIAREKAEAKERERKRLEAERIAKEKAEAERVAREKAEAEERERRRLEAERIAKEKAEAERIAREKAEAKERERKRLEEERIAREKAEAEARDRKRLEAERLAKEKAEAERVAREKAEAAERERKRVEAERVAREKVEADRRAREKAEAERAAREKAEAAERERKRLEAERVAKDKADAEERKRVEAERVAREKAEAEERERKRQEAERAAREKADADRAAREQEEADRREREPATKSSPNWLVPPEQASKFEPPQDRATPAPGRGYPVYVPPVEQPRWSGAPVDVSSVGGNYDPPTATPLPNLAQPTPAYGAPTPIRLKSADSGVAPRPIVPERPLEREDEPLKYEHRMPSFEEEPPARQIPWKIVAAAGVVLVAGLAAFYLYSPISSPLLSKPVEAKTTTADKPTGPVSGGRIEITTDPAGAKILVDGKEAGQSPLTLDGISAGRHVVTMVGDGGAVRRTIRVETGKSVTLNVSIYSGFAAVSAPFIVTVSEGGRTVGTSENPLMLAPGRHILKFSNDDLGYAASQTVEIQPGESTRVQLDPKGTANINAEPWAEVYIDGVKVGDTPLANLPISLGVREIVFKNPDLGERKVVATITAGSPAIISVDFNK